MDIHAPPSLESFGDPPDLEPGQLITIGGKLTYLLVARVVHFSASWNVVSKRDADEKLTFDMELTKTWAPFWRVHVVGTHIPEGEVQLVEEAEILSTHDFESRAKKLMALLDVAGDTRVE